jgi:hypothetical protein
VRPLQQVQGQVLQAEHANRVAHVARATRLVVVPDGGPGVRRAGPLTGFYCESWAKQTTYLLNRLN